MSRKGFLFKETYSRCILPGETRYFTAAHCGGGNFDKLYIRIQVWMKSRKERKTLANDKQLTKFQFYWRKSFMELLI